MSEQDQTLNLTDDLFNGIYNEEKIIIGRKNFEKDSFYDILDQMNDQKQKIQKKIQVRVKLPNLNMETINNNNLPAQEYFPQIHGENKKESCHILQNAAKYGLLTPDSKLNGKNFLFEDYDFPNSARLNSNPSETPKMKSNNPKLISPQIRHPKLPEKGSNHTQLAQTKQFIHDNHIEETSNLLRNNKLKLPTLSSLEEISHSPLSNRIVLDRKILKIPSENNLESRGNRVESKILKLNPEESSILRSGGIKSLADLKRNKSEDDDYSIVHLSPSSANIRNFDGIYKVGLVTDPLASFKAANSSLLLKQIFSPSKDSTASSDQEIQSPFTERFLIEVIKSMTSNLKDKQMRKTKNKKFVNIPPRMYKAN